MTNTTRKLTGIASLLVVGTMLLAACGDTAATSTPVPAPTATTAPAMMGETPTAMMAGETPTAMMTGETPTAMMAGETPTTMMAETPTGMMGNSYAVVLNPQNNSTQVGAAVITDLGNGKVAVAIDITANGITDPQPAHIHKGTCAALDPNPAYPLTSVIDGKSLTEVEVNFADLVASPYAINIHKSAADAGTYVACGDITRDSMTTVGTPGAMMGETPTAMMEGETPTAMMEGETPTP